ncbi:hypothetical protein CBG53_06125 [Porphyromonas gingivalis]|nr:hypothetical protein CBG53_06125 [Porphyromonas gingivalis]
MLFSTRHSKIFPFDTPKNMAWELFGFGAESKKFSRHNEKNLVPFFQINSNQNLCIFGSNRRI